MNTFFFFKCYRTFLHLIVLQRAVGIAAQRMQKTPFLWCVDKTDPHLFPLSRSPSSTKCSWLPLLSVLQDGIWVSADILSVLVFSLYLLQCFFLQKYNPVRIEWNTFKAGIFSTDEVPQSPLFWSSSLFLFRWINIWCKTSHISIPKPMYWGRGGGNRFSLLKKKKKLLLHTADPWLSMALYQERQ